MIDQEGTFMPTLRMQEFKIDKIRIETLSWKPEPSSIIPGLCPIFGSVLRDFRDPSPFKNGTEFGTFLAQ